MTGSCINFLHKFRELGGLFITATPFVTRAIMITSLYNQKRAIAPLTTPKLFGCLIFFCCWSNGGAQQIKIDSLNAIVRGGITTQNRLKASLQLATLLHESEPYRALALAKKALSIAEQKKYQVDIAYACNTIGAIHHNLSHYDSSFIFHRKALSMALAYHYDLEVAQAYQGIAENYMRLSKTDSSEYYFRKEMAIGMRMQNASLIAGVHNNLGNLYLEENKWSESLKEYISAATIYDSAAHDSAGFGKALSNIGNVECVLGHYDKALKYSTQALSLFQEKKNDLGVAFCLRLIGRVYRKQALYTKALQQYEQVKKIYSRLGDKRSMSETCQNMGNIYYDLGNFMKALAQYEESLRIAKDVDSPKQTAYAYSALGYVWNELHDPVTALKFIDSSFVKAKQLGDADLVMDAFDIRCAIYTGQHNYKNALEAHQALSHIKDSLNAIANKREGEEMEAKYESEKKQAQINLLQKNRQLQEATLRQHELRVTALAVALSLIIIISFLLFNRYKIIQNSKRQLDIERMRNAVARDLHDNIGSTLSSINIISQVALKEGKPDNFHHHFQRISEQSLKMMENMSDMVWSINPNNDSMEKMVVRMKEFLAEILEPKNIFYEFQGEDILHGTILNVEERKNLFLIFKEAVNNAAKYSYATLVHILFTKTNNYLSISIRDNGRGFDQSVAKSGNGLRNMKDRAKTIGGTINLETSIQGTTITLTVPLT